MVAPTATCWRIVQCVATVLVMWLTVVTVDDVRQAVCNDAVSGVGVKRENYRNAPYKEMSEVPNVDTGGTCNIHRALRG